MQKTIEYTAADITALVVAAAKKEMGIVVDPEISVAGVVGNVGGQVENLSIRLSFPPNSDPVANLPSAQ